MSVPHLPAGPPGGGGGPVRRGRWRRAWAWLVGLFWHDCDDCGPPFRDRPRDW